MTENMNIPNMANNIRIGVCGNVDAGKSTLIGVLTHNILDDGKGYARSKVLRTKHEQITGRTSSISYNYLNYDNRTTTLLDLAGHEKYLKTTLYGITGSFLHYGLVIIGANMGVSMMTKEHLSILLFLRIPIIVVVTKIDMTPEQVYENTMTDIMKILRLPVFRKQPLILNDENYENYVKNAKNGYEHINHLIPIIQVSSKIGTNIDKLSMLFKILPNNTIKNRCDNIVDHPIIRNSKIKEEIKELSVSSSGLIVYLDKVYQVKGIGYILTGNITGNPLNGINYIKKDQILYIGPMPDGKFIDIKVKSMHDSKRQLINETYNGDSIIMAIKYDKKYNLSRNHFYKGLVALTDNQDQKYLTKEFVCQLKILNKKTLVKEGYTPVIHCNTIRQTAKVIKVITDNNENVAQTGQNVRVVFQMTQSPILVIQGDIIYLRDGVTKGVGIVIEPLY